MTKRRPDGKRMQAWTLRAEVDGTVTVLHGNRLIAANLSPEEAKGRMNRVDGERVYTEEPDGYRTRVRGT